MHRESRNLIPLYIGDELLGNFGFHEIVEIIGGFDKLVTLELLRNGGKVNLDNIKLPEGFVIRGDYLNRDIPVK